MLDLRKGAALALTAALLLTACGQGGPKEPTVEPISLEYDRAAGNLVLLGDTTGGLAAYPSGRHIPEVSIYGDGLVVLGQEDGARRVGIDRGISMGYIGEEELARLLDSIAGTGFFQLDDRYPASPTPTETLCRQVMVRLIGRVKTVSVCPLDYAEAPAAFGDVYEMVVGISPLEPTTFIPSSGTLFSTDLGPIEELGGGRANQVAPWDTPLLGLAVEEAEEGVHLDGERYRVVEEFLLRYPPGQLFGSQEGRAYEVLLEDDLPWERQPSN
jgi:hypothetical protein